MGKARGGGSIVQLDSGKSRARCRRWRIVISMGRDPITKKRLPPRTKRVCGTYTEAQAALREFLIEVENGPDGGGGARRRPCDEPEPHGPGAGLPAG